ncbi:MAG: PLP-dependent aminotransferase family protein [Cellulosilyticaceae bacterium]
MFCTIKLSKSDPTPLYIQLAHELADLIRTGQLPSQTKLPTIRKLSRMLQINRDTVVSAYKMLEQEGLVIGHMGSGTYVAPLLPTVCEPVVQTPISCSALSLGKEIMPIDFCKQLLAQMLDQDGWNCFVDPLFRNKLLLKQAIVTYLKSVGIMTTPPQVRVIKDMNTLILDLLKCSNKSCICVEEYHDLTYTSFIQSLGYKIYEIPLTAEGMDLQILEKYLKTGTISYIWCSSYIQNPTGITYSLDNKKALLDLCEQYDCYILEDGSLSDFAYHEFLEPLHSLSYEQRVIYIHHFSKLYLPYLHYSFVALPASWTKKIPDTLECTLNECFLEHYLESEYFSSIRAELINQCHERYQLITQQLKRCELALSFEGHEDGLFFWVKPLKFSSIEAVQLFVDYQIILAPGEVFTHRHNSPYFRISISSLDSEGLEHLLEVLKLFAS